MAEFTGISLNFGNNGEAEVVHAKKILPHRLDLIEARLEKKELKGLDDMFFTFKVPEECRTRLTRDDVTRENRLYETFLRLSKKIIDFPDQFPKQIDTSPDAA